MKVLGLEMSPLKIPLERRLQTAAVYQYTLTFLLVGFGCVFLAIYLLFTRFYFVTLLYIIWYIFDRHTSARGGRRVQWIREGRVWNYFVDYFPMKLIKTAEVSPDKNYIFATHPHGVMCHSHFGNFATEGTGFSKLFPGLTPHLLTLGGQYAFPFFRDYFMMSGACEVSKASMDYILSQKGKGNVIALITGGALEALNATPGNYKLVLKHRRGFVKIAMKHGASLCPVYAFGENTLYTQVPNPEGSFLRKFQGWMTTVCGFAPPVFHGRGAFNYTFGLLPYRRPTNTVVGKPIDVEKNENPTREEVDELHQKYIDALVDLFETHKTKYGVDADSHLEFT